MATEQRRRLERVYMALTGSATPHGAISWFAEQVPCGVNTASRFVNGHTDPRPRVVERLEELEREVADAEAE